MSDTTPGAGPTPEPEPTPEPTPASSGQPTPDRRQPTPASSGRPSGSSQANEAVETLKKANPLDLGIIGAGVLAFLGSLMPYYTISVEVFGTSAGGSGNAWSGGFLGWFGALLALAGAGSPGREDPRRLASRPGADDRARASSPPPRC